MSPFGGWWLQPLSTPELSQVSFPPPPFLLRIESTRTRKVKYVYRAPRLYLNTVNALGGGGTYDHVLIILLTIYAFGIELTKARHDVLDAESWHFLLDN